jgi:4-hydroxy-tetrahydrodipicolinate synthase
MTFEPQGVYAASLTPMTADLEPDLGRLVAHSKWLLANGCDGLGILGTTGEANSLTLKQRRAVIDAAIAALPRERLMPGVGSCALADVVELTKACLAGGVRDVLCLPPFYYKGVPDDGVEAFFATVIDRVGDARLRLYLYNFPQLTGYPFPLALVERLKARFGATIAGMKDSSGDWANMKLFAEKVPGFKVFAGTEQYLADILAVGGAGCISATTNLTSPWAKAVLEAKEPAARAKAQELLTAMRLAIQAKPLIPALKGLMQELTGDAAWRHIAPPNALLTAAEIGALRDKLAELGLKRLKLAA